jgi:hypothetical protein
VRLALAISLLILPLAAQGESPNYADKIRPSILEAWKYTVEKNRGVHAWNEENDGSRVFQEWITLMTLARGKSPEERARVGQALEKYVVDGRMRPTTKVGTTVPMPGYDQGDFDMTLLGAVSMLWLFQDDRLLLTDATLIHLVEQVVGLWGQDPKASFEVFFLSVPETENHLFMTESTRFLTNQLIWENPRRLPEFAALRDSLEKRGQVLDNGKGSLRRLLLKVMHQAMRKGFFEFNAQIYQRFTIHALDNLYSFSHDSSVSQGAGCLLDYLSAVFAFQSQGSLRYGPYRRSAEAYQDSSLVYRDAACSFFAAQSGAIPWSTNPRTGFWQGHQSHSSMALFSTVLAYRVPDPILAYMRGPAGEYRAEIRSAYAGSGGRDRATEVYYGAKNYLISAGGRYETYSGPNFPTPMNWFGKSGPWIYDVVTRSSSVILDPMREKPGLLRDILHFRGEQWKGNNLAIARNFLYGYSPSQDYDSPEWPQHVPAGWKDDGKVYETRDFDFRFIDRSDAGVYLVLARLKPAKTFLSWGYQKFTRGTIEVVDTSRVKSLEELREQTLLRNTSKGTWPLARRYVYVTAGDDRIYLNARYDGEREGIAKVVEQPKPEAGGIPLVTLPFQFPWLGLDRPASKFAAAGFIGRDPSRDKPLFQVDMAAPWKGKVALSDGEGNMYVYSPATGGYCLANFREWWNPRRMIK